jgi:hypothetical protein
MKDKVESAEGVVVDKIDFISENPFFSFSIFSLIEYNDGAEIGAPMHIYMYIIIYIYIYIVCGSSG